MKIEGIVTAMISECHFKVHVYHFNESHKRKVVPMCVKETKISCSTYRLESILASEYIIGEINPQEDKHKEVIN